MTWMWQDFVVSTATVDGRETVQLELPAFFAGKAVHMGMIVGDGPYTAKVNFFSEQESFSGATHYALKHVISRWVWGLLQQTPKPAEGVQPNKRVVLEALQRKGTA